MIAVALVLVTLIVVVGVLADRHWPRAPEPVSPIEQRMREHMIVTLKSGDSFGGILWAADAKVWVLREAIAIGASSSQPNVGVDGEVVLPADNVAFAQRT